jgi:hypothetical protein
MKLNKQFALLAILLLSISAFGGVNLKNGNYYITYTDIVVPGGGEKLEVSRTYNSKATELGWFGFGWGSYFETNLVVSADGSAVIHENGAGGKTRFTPKNPVDPSAAADKIIAKIRKKSTLTEKSAKSLKKRLVSNAELRHAYAVNYKIKTQLANKSVLFSNQRGIQELHKTKKGFKRLYSDGKKEYFNNEGKFVKVVHKSGYKIDLKYNKDGSLKTIKDSQAKQIFFSWYSNGRIEKIWSSKDKHATYKFKGKDLVESKDLAGNKYQYSYKKNHYLSKILYKDKTFTQIGYNKKTFFVTSVKDRGGDLTNYKYESNPKNRDFHYWTKVTKKGYNGKEMTNRYEYEIKARPDGSQYTYRILTKINNIQTETIYSECCSLPLKIARGKQVTTFEYNSDGLLTKKSSTKGDFVNITYNKKIKKISKVVNNAGWTKFDYDKKGNLTKAVSSKGKAVLLVYNLKGKITKMIDNNSKTKKRRTLSFKYNSLGKPIEIEMDSVGKINVSYDNYGEIKKVDSKQGHKMALQVTQAFQNLLSIVKPAGVNLNM